MRPGLCGERSARGACGVRAHERFRLWRYERGTRFQTLRGVNKVGRQSSRRRWEAGADVGRSSIPVASLPGATLVSRALRLSFRSWGNSWRYRHAAHLGPNTQRSFSSALSHPRRRSVLRSQPLALGVQKLPLPRHILSRVFRAGYSVTEELPFLFLIANMWVGVLRVQHVLSSHRSFGNLSEA